MKKLRISVEGKTYEVTVEVLEDTDEWSTAVPTSPLPTTSRAPAEIPQSAAAAPASPAAAKQGDVISPMSATVVSVLVKQGETVEAGQTLAVLEAMKMETSVTAPAAGVVASVHVQAGDTIGEGQALVSVA